METVLPIFAVLQVLRRMHAPINIAPRTLSLALAHPDGIIYIIGPIEAECVSQYAHA